MKNPFRKHMRIVESYTPSGRPYHVVQTWYPWWPIAWWTETSFNNIRSYDSAKAYVDYCKTKPKRSKVLWEDGVTL